MEKYIEDTINRAMALRKNAKFALNNALSFVLSKRGLSATELDKFSIRFDDDAETNKIYFNSNDIGMDINTLDNLTNAEFYQLTKSNDNAVNNMLLPETDFKK